jgi:hypothetical protein
LNANPNFDGNPNYFLLNWKRKGTEGSRVIRVSVWLGLCNAGVDFESSLMKRGWSSDEEESIEVQSDWNWAVNVHKRYIILSNFALSSVFFFRHFLLASCFFPPAPPNWGKEFVPVSDDVCLWEEDCLSIWQKCNL